MWTEWCTEKPQFKKKSFTINNHVMFSELVLNTYI